MAAALAKSDATDDALQLVAEVVGSDEIGEESHQLGRVRALIAQAWTRSAERDHEDIDDMVRKAVEALRQAHARGKYQKKDALNSLKNSAEFDQLRGRDDFNQLLDDAIQSVGT